VIHLTLEELLQVAEQTLGRPAPVRDVGLLGSALARAGTTVGGGDAYPALEEKAAALVHSLVRNRALVDGNKRLGLAGLIIFLGVNDYRLGLTNDQAYDLIVEIAEGRLDEVGAISARTRAALIPR
jgi:death-on-curing protein